MSAPSTVVTVLDVCQRILELTRRQAELIQAGDFERFEHLAIERGTLQRRLDGALEPRFVGAAREALEQAVALDRRNLALVRQLMSEVDAALQQVRRGQAALTGYGRPGTHLMDQASVLDQAS